MSADADVSGKPGSPTGKPGTIIDEEVVRALARLLDEMHLTQIEIERDGMRVRVAREPGAASMLVPPASAPVQPLPLVAGTGITSSDPAQHPGVVTSPMVGTAYRAPEPGARPFCEIGSGVKTGNTLLVIEAMKTLNQILAPRSGTVRQILFEDAQPVEFGEPLLIIE
jgi:acetyl-CoA carboxylase biotin carboxyl carrier protein